MRRALAIVALVVVFVAGGWAWTHRARPRSPAALSCVAFTVDRRTASLTFQRWQSTTQIRPFAAWLRV